MIAQVKAWGNGQGVRAFKELLDTIGVRVDDGKIDPYEEFLRGDEEGSHALF